MDHGVDNVSSLRIGSHLPAHIVNGGGDGFFKIEEFLTWKVS